MEKCNSFQRRKRLSFVGISRAEGAYTVNERGQIGNLKIMLDKQWIICYYNIAVRGQHK